MWWDKTRREVMRRDNMIESEKMRRWAQKRQDEIWRG